MIKKITAVLLALLIAILLCSCTAQKPIKTHDVDRFMLVETFSDCSVYADLQTGVEWILRGGAFAPAVDSYGRPLLWPGFDAREDRPHA